MKLDKDVVFIVTSSHVIGFEENPEIEFFTKKGQRFSAKIEHKEPLQFGLALLSVKGDLPPGLSELPMATSVDLNGAESCIAIGCPLDTGPWSVATLSYSSTKGFSLYFQPAVLAGYSGGPVIQDNKVVGLIQAAGEDETSRKPNTLATISDAVRVYVKGFGIEPIQTSLPAEKAEVFDEISSDLNSYVYQLNNIVGAFQRNALAAVTDDNRFELLRAASDTYEKAWKKLYDNQARYGELLRSRWSSEAETRFNALFQQKIMPVHVEYVFKRLNNVKNDMYEAHKRKKIDSQKAESMTSTLQQIKDGIDDKTKEMQPAIKDFLQYLRL